MNYKGTEAMFVCELAVDIKDIEDIQEAIRFGASEKLAGMAAPAPLRTRPQHIKQQNLLMSLGTVRTCPLLVIFIVC